METYKINKLLFWAVIILAILNITTISTIIYGNLNKSKAEEAIIIDSRNTPLNGRNIKENLRFDDEQMALYRETNQEFRNKANEILFHMEALKGKLFNELQKPDPDRKRTREISDSIGMAHADLKEATVDFYVKLKECCNGEQNESLRNMFSPLFEERGHQNMGGRSGRGNRRGAGNGNY